MSFNSFGAAWKSATAMRSAVRCGLFRVDAAISVPFSTGRVQPQNCMPGCESGAAGAESSLEQAQVQTAAVPQQQQDVRGRAVSSATGNPGVISGMPDARSPKMHKPRTM